MTDPQPNMHETPEFKKAVAEQVATLVAPILKQMEDARTGGGSTQSDHGFAEMLAMSIAQLNDQGTGRKRVAPEVLKARSDARDEMTQLIIRAREEGQKPVYTLRNKIYLDEVLVDPIYLDAAKRQQSTEIIWPGVPNEAMIPKNQVAKDIFELFLKSIGSVVKVTVEAPKRVTPGGLVVHQGRERIATDGEAPPVARSEIGRAMAESFGEGLKINRRGSGGEYRDVSILGTVAAPAQQTA